mmetsp:Transcript_3784/g.11808  ORF Transcript_3784/g.11808 Transcript_3784/m.11808 type:complete len:343 (+) Transcript_3784:955-1983(+)
MNQWLLGEGRVLGGPERGGRSSAPSAESVQFCGGCCAAFVAFILFFCLASLSPNEYGIFRNYLSGSLDFDVRRGGIYVTWPTKSFIKFPAAQQTLEFSGGSMDRPPVSTTTGADPKDPDSGGQPIVISCAIQFQFVRSTLRDVYLAFGSYEAARQRYLLLTKNQVSNTAQQFTPQDFWQRRDAIADKMLRHINETLWEDGYVVAMRFEIMKVDFAKGFEDSITAVQVAEQQRVVNSYDQQVQQVVQSIEVLKADNLAAIANISASADADAKEICAGATRDAFHLKQAMKAEKYAELQRELGLDPQQMQEYFKIKSVQGQGQSGQVVVGVPRVGGEPGHKGTL